MARAKQPATKTVYQLKITLVDIEPSIWRRLQVPGNTRLPDLHLMLQAAMGWYNCHLHSFTIDDMDYGAADDDFDDSLIDHKRVRLDQVVQRAKARFTYLYDFGDGWEHEIVVEKSLPPESGVNYPVCRAGEQHCPPEDCGGAYGYEEFLEAIRNPRHEEHENMLEWIGGSFDPDSFDVDAINGSLQDYKMLDPRNC